MKDIFCHLTVGAQNGSYGGKLGVLENLNSKQNTEIDCVTASDPERFVSAVSIDETYRASCLLSQFISNCVAYYLKFVNSLVCNMSLRRFTSCGAVIQDSGKPCVLFK